MIFSKKTFVKFSQERVLNSVAPRNNNVSDNNTSAESSAGLPPVSPNSIQSTTQATNKHFVPERLDISKAKDHITHFVLPSPTRNMPPTPVFSTGSISPRIPVSPAVSPNETNVGSFVPYFMTIAEPRALELQRASYASTASHQQAQLNGEAACGQAASAKNKTDIAPAYISTGQLTPRTGNNSLELDGPQPSEESTTMRIKRSISTLLHRSSSVLRKSEPTSPSIQSRSARRSSNSDTLQRRSPKSVPVSRTSTELPRSKNAKVTEENGNMPSPTSSHSKDVIAAALSPSYFNMVFSNGIVSPLIRGSMVHVKVVMDASTIVVVPMMRSEVFARARERIITKLFQGGVSLVESKRRKLVVCGANGKTLVIDNNPTWRKVMDAIGSVYLPCSPKPANSRAVAKLTLRLMGTQDIGMVAGGNCLSHTISCTTPVAKTLAVADKANNISMSMPMLF
ncbi:hypothetical protein GGI11_001674 [Coemansia sp. RSA 2049]|nr:hypothetical protein GGI11_001674 [Coemansia sp. RSA 2049]